MINLDNLLDNDQLSPEQQRFVRKAVKYYIKKETHGEYAIYFKIPQSKVTQVYYFNGNPELAYKQIMYYLISFYKFNGSIDLSTEVKQLFTSEGENYMNYLPITAKSQYLYNLLQRVKTAGLGDVGLFRWLSKLTQ